MKRLAVFLVLMPCLLCACTATQALDSYERDELLSIKHNPKTDCTLLTYRDPLGQTRHVFRKHGVYADIEQGGPAKYSIYMSLFIMILQCQGFF